jgi:hypothetical protein
MLIDGRTLGPSAATVLFSTAPVGIVVTNNLYSAKSERANLLHAPESRDDR